MTTKLIECTCSHPYQQNRYGNKRVMNKKAGDKKVYTCTVCSREHSKDDGDSDKKSKK